VNVYDDYGCLCSTALAIIVAARIFRYIISSKTGRE
jgi:hypothetical protein